MSQPEDTEPGKLHDLNDLAGVAEVAQALGVSRQAVSNWAAGRARKAFPPALRHLHATPLYSLKQIRDWYDSLR